MTDNIETRLKELKELVKEIPKLSEFEKRLYEDRLKYLSRELEKLYADEKPVLGKVQWRFYERKKY